MERTGVLGAGIMGHSIALNLAWAGRETSLWGTDEGELERAKREIGDKIERLTAGGLVKEEPERIAARIRYTTSLEDAADGVTFLIEAIPEQLELKQQFYKRLDEMCAPSVVLASNTSGLRPSDIAACMKHPERMTVTHFWNPAHLIPLVEVVRGKHTSRETVDRALALLRAIGKKPIEVKKEVPGFVANRLQYALFREAQHILEEGVADLEDIDAAVVYSIGRRLPVTGPFMTADMGGLDVFHSISEYLFRDLSKAEGSLSLMRSLVEQGKYGIKSDAGFYAWGAAQKQEFSRKREELLIRFLKQDLNGESEEEDREQPQSGRED